MLKAPYNKSCMFLQDSCSYLMIQHFHERFLKAFIWSCQIIYFHAAKRDAFMGGNNFLVISLLMLHLSIIRILLASY